MQARETEGTTCLAYPVLMERLAHCRHNKTVWASCDRRQGHVITAQSDCSEWTEQLIATLRHTYSKPRGKAVVNGLISFPRAALLDCNWAMLWFDFVEDDLDHPGCVAADLCAAVAG